MIQSFLTNKNYDINKYSDWKYVEAVNAYRIPASNLSNLNNMRKCSYIIISTTDNSYTYITKGLLDGSGKYFNPGEFSICYSIDELVVTVDDINKLKKIPEIYYDGNIICSINKDLDVNDPSTYYNIDFGGIYKFDGEVPEEILIGKLPGGVTVKGKLKEYLYIRLLDNKDPNKVNVSIFELNSTEITTDNDLTTIYNLSSATIRIKLYDSDDNLLSNLVLEFNDKLVLNGSGYVVKDIYVPIGYISDSLSSGIESKNGKVTSIEFDAGDGQSKRLKIINVGKDGDTDYTLDIN